MLTELLRLMDQNQGQLDLGKLSRELGAHPTAVAGMIDTLVRKGRLREMLPVCGSCDVCGVKNSCGLPSNSARKFQMAPRNALPLQRHESH